jgi:hypothetical protein
MDHVLRPTRRLPEIFSTISSPAKKSNRSQDWELLSASRPEAALYQNGDPISEALMFVLIIHRILSAKEEFLAY